MQEQTGTSVKRQYPFHSPMLQEAAGQLKEVLDQIECSPLQIPYVTNVTGRYVSDIEETKELLIQQIAAPVRWQQSVEEMIRQGVDTFVEIDQDVRYPDFYGRSTVM